MIIDAVIQTKNETESDESFLNRVVAWSHQCWQRHKLDNDIDVDEFKRRLNVENIDYKLILLDHEEELEKHGKTYILRTLHILYPEEFVDPDKPEEFVNPDKE